VFGRVWERHWTNQNCVYIETESVSVSANACYKTSQVKYLLVESDDAEGCLRLLTTAFFAVRGLSCLVLQTILVLLVYLLCLSI
jgi:hypothetical protein